MLPSLSKVSKLRWALLVTILCSCSGDDDSGPSACAGQGGDRDGDDVCQAADNCPDDENPTQRDADTDGIGDACDPTPVECDAHGGDDDNDTVCDAFDNCLNVVNLDQLDRDFDGDGDACDAELDPSGAAGAGGNERCNGIGGDEDADNWCALDDNCPGVYNPGQDDADADQVGDACDEETCDGLDNDGNGEIDEEFPDRDGDGVADCRDKCPNAEDTDDDGDLLVDCLDKCPDDIVNDPDNDGICAAVDNCPAVSNASQVDADHDGIGDTCELEVCDGIDNDGDNVIDESTGAGDEDGDGVCDAIDSCPSDPINDIDGDGLCVEDDNCAGVPNPTQVDTDEDGWGDACDLDSAVNCGASATLGSTAIPANLLFEFLAVDSTRSLILGTVRSASPVLANQLVAIDPSTQTMLWSVNVGSDPGRLAITSDGSRAYVALEGAASVRVVDLALRRACFQFTIASRRLRETVVVSDLAVLPSQPETLVVSARGGSFDGLIQVLDNGTPRPVEFFGASSSSPTFIETIDDSRLWMMSQSFSLGPLELRVDEDGVRSTNQRPLSNVRFSNADMVYAGDVLYLTNGQAVDPFVPRLLGTFPITGPLAVDAERNEAFFSASSSSSSLIHEVRVYGTRDFTLLRSMPVPLPTTSFNTVSQILRWGATGLVLNSSTGAKFMTIGN